MHTLINFIITRENLHIFSNEYLACHLSSLLERSVLAYMATISPSLLGWISRAILVLVTVSNAFTNCNTETPAPVPKLYVCGGKTNFCFIIPVVSTCPRHVRKPLFSDRSYCTCTFLWEQQQWLKYIFLFQTIIDQQMNMNFLCEFCVYWHKNCDMYNIDRRSWRWSAIFRYISNVIIELVVLRQLRQPFGEIKLQNNTGNKRTTNLKKMNYSDLNITVIE